MESNTFDINWEAIGSILTGLGLIFAFWSIHESNGQNKKNRDLEIRLRRQENEQKWLDEYVQTVLKILAILRFKEISFYIKKCCSDSYTKEDIRYFENLSFQFDVHLLELYIKNHKVKSNKDTNLIQNHLGRINNYLQDLSFKLSTLQFIDLQKEIIPSLKEDIKKLNNGILPESCLMGTFDYIDEKSYLKRLLHKYSILVTEKIIFLQSEVKVNVEKYMKNEQKRIDGLSIGLESTNNKSIWKFGKNID